MRHGSALLGGIFLHQAEAAPGFTEDEADTVRALASIATIGIQNARLLSEETTRSERATLLRHIGSQVRGTLDIDTVLSTTVEELGRAAQVDRCFIRLGEGHGSTELAPIAHEWDAEGVVALRGDPDVQFPVSALAARSRSTRWSDDVATDAQVVEQMPPGGATDLIAHGVRAVLSTPLEWGDEFMGVVTFHASAPRDWTMNDIELIEGAAREVSIGLHHAQLYNEAMGTVAHLGELDQMRSDFVTMVSHELRSPMTVIAGIADLLLRRRDRLSEDEIDELVGSLGREARRLARLVSEVLNLEAIDRGGMLLKLEDVDLARLAEETVADTGESRRTNLQIEGAIPTMRADPDKLKQVILNLISNAAKFSPDGAQIALRIAADGDMLRVTVTDQGPGIPEPEREKLFQRFSRLSTTKGKTGSGLGLYLSRLIVERHGGTIWAERPEAGAAFSFAIPLAGPPEEPEEEEEL
jgi:signal transduction histidine kinase